MTGSGERGRIGIHVNGSERSVPSGRTVLGLLEELELNPGLVVVERNREILDRDRLGEAELAEGDVLEIVHFVGGG